MESLLEIQSMFSRSFAEGTMEALSPDTFLSYPRLNIANRYFTSRRDDPYSVAIPFGSAIDPKGILADLANESWFHAPDNDVVYYHFIPDGPQQKWVINYMSVLITKHQNKYHPLEPIRFRIGDIVEAQMSCVVIPLKGGKFKMINQLRSLALLDGTHTQVCLSIMEYTLCETDILT
jgi:hypothetical protein